MGKAAPKRPKGRKPAKLATVKEPDGVIRAITLPVGAPVGRSWEELNAALKDCFRLSTDLANWCVHQLYRTDTTGDPKTPATVKNWYGYGEASRLYKDWQHWSGAMSSAQCVIRGVQRKYIQDRFAVMVRHEQQCLTYRYPYPFPVHNQSWRTSYADGGFPVVTVNLPGHGSFELRLKRRADFGRQLAGFKALHDGTAVKGEAALYRNGKGDLLVKLVGKFVRRPRGERVHAAVIRTDPAALLVVEIDGRSPWILNADHLRRWQAVHKVYRQRISEDAKREKRMSRRQRSHLNKSRDLRCEKHRHRLDSAVHQLSAQVARFCQRQGVATVAYDDADKSYIPDGFPWHALKERLRYKLDGDGVEWIERATGKPEGE